MLTHGSLFSGIGGFDLAAEWMKWNNIFHCEFNPFGQKVLKHYWPNAISYDDITTTDFSIHQNRIGILSGGFPCQGFSIAGLRKGTADNRYLWPEMLRAIREIQPIAVVGENVTGLISMEEQEMFAKVEGRTITRYQDADHYEAIYTRQSKMLITSIIKDLESEGYKVQTFVIPAASIGAPHRRDRVWIIGYNQNNLLTANPRSNGHQPGKPTTNTGTKGTHESKKIQRQRVWPNVRRTGSKRITPNTKYKGFQITKKSKQQIHIFNVKRNNLYATNPINKRFQRHKWDRSSNQWQWQKTLRPATQSFEIQSWDNWPTQPPVCSGNDGISAQLDTITFPKWINESIKAAGNAIVPQVAYQIFQAIQELINNKY